MDEPIVATRTDLDNIVFSAAQELADTQTHLSVRERMKFALNLSDRIMDGIDNLGGAAKRSEAAKKAAAARYANKPKPGPAIPPPAPGTAAPTTQDPAGAAAGMAPEAPPPLTPPPMAPPPHPSLLPPGAVPAMPFGAAPA